MDTTTVIIAPILFRTFAYSCRLFPISHRAHPRTVTPYRLNSSQLRIDCLVKFSTFATRLRFSNYDPVRRQAAAYLLCNGTATAATGSVGLYIPSCSSVLQKYERMMPKRGTLRASDEAVISLHK